jgi:Ceramidase
VDWLLSVFSHLISKPTLVYCEKAGSGLVARPGYAVSNLLYIIIGIFILIKDWKNRVSRTFGFMTIAVGMFSFIYDTAHVYWSQLLDLTAMFVFAGFILVLNIKRWSNPPSKTLRLIYTALILVAVSLIYIFRSFSGDIVFGIFVFSIIISEGYLLMRNKKNQLYRSRYWALAFMTFLAGIFLWFIDVLHLWCDPLNILNGRAVFHYLGAIGIYFLYKFYKQFRFITVTRDFRHE